MPDRLVDLTAVRAARASRQVGVAPSTAGLRLAQYVAAEVDWDPIAASIEDRRAVIVGQVLELDATYADASLAAVTVSDVWGDATPDCMAALRRLAPALAEALGELRAVLQR